MFESTSHNVITYSYWFSLGLRFSTYKTETFLNWCLLKLIIKVTNKQMTWSRDFLEKLTGPQQVKKFPAFMEPESSLLYSE